MYVLVFSTGFFSFPLTASTVNKRVGRRYTWRCTLTQKQQQQQQQQQQNFVDLQTLTLSKFNQIQNVEDISFQKIEVH